MVCSLGSFLEFFDFGLQILQVAFFSLTESSLGSSVLRLTLLEGSISVLGSAHIT